MRSLWRRFAGVSEPWMAQFPALVAWEPWAERCCVRQRAPYRWATSAQDDGFR